MTLCYRSIFLIFFLATLRIHALAQGGTWTWMHGADTAASTGNYGTKGVPSPANEPPARYESCYWTDKQGNFWLFGGTNVGGLVPLSNDLWKYDVTSNMWTWMNGPTIMAPNTLGVYGTKGIPSVNNFPPARGYGANCWTDSSGDLWLSGGMNMGSVFDDLWKYHIATNQWTWVFGNSTGPPVYGTKGIAAASNSPGVFSESKSGWVDANNRIWMFGGVPGYIGAPNPAELNTMWKYDISAGLWTWVSGTNTVNATGNYGIKGIETASNLPSARMSYTRWKDAQGNFYLFGGCDSAPYQHTRNDVWRYRPGVNRWTWVAGTNLQDNPGLYPLQKCTFSKSNNPKARLENTSAVSTYGECSTALWMFGGFDAPSGLDHNDLWLFRTDSMQWAWISGDSTTYYPGNYGVRGVPSSTNMLPSRGGNAIWVDKNHNVWIFGGGRFGYIFESLNDLWRFTPDSTCVNFRALFTSGALIPPDTFLCQGDASSMQTGMHTSVSYSPGTGVTPNGDTSLLLFRPSSTTTYQVVVSGRSCWPDDTSVFTIHVYPRDTVSLSLPTPLALCKNDTAIMSVKAGWTISVSPNIGVSYQATGGTAIKFYPSAAFTQYRVTAKSSATCSTAPDTIRFAITRDTSTLHILPMTDTILCKGDTAAYMPGQKVDAWSVNPAAGFSVNKDTTIFRFFPEYSTSYRFVGIKNKGCQPKDTIYFNIHRSIIKAGFLLTPRVATTNAAHFTLNNTSGGADSYQWYVNGHAFSTQASPSYTATDSGRYCFTLVASDDYQCSDTAMDCADVISQLGAYVPSAFSPNGDGINDVLYVRGRGIQSVSLKIFNRWGQRVFETNDVSKGWDGKYDGDAQDAEVFSYVLYAAFIDGTATTKKGNVTILK